MRDTDARQNKAVPSNRGPMTSWKGHLLGPHGTGDYRAKLSDHVHYIGTRTAPKEGTSDAMYLWRPSPYNPPPWSHRDRLPGEIGWGVEDLGYFSRRALSRVKPIMPEVHPPAEEYELINRQRNPSLQRYLPPDPQYLFWRDSLNYQPFMPSMDRPETSPYPMKG
nr:PREDICTED: uncharacterized protein C4orf45 homolog isoform X2 [Anolis carolinensis]|eukprot:XP_016849563.1 PREDICTED: uncharacterized protein C4orf45 homolog isoform X2 [Anolis carolinensis]